MPVRASSVPCGEVTIDDGVDGPVQGDNRPPRAGSLLHTGLDGFHIVADKQDGTALPAHLAHLPQAFLLKRRVSDGENLVDHQDFRLEMGRDGESQPHVHATGIPLDRRVEESLDLGESDDLVELAGDLSRDMPRIAPLR